MVNLRALESEQCCCQKTLFLHVQQIAVISYTWTFVRHFFCRYGNHCDDQMRLKFGNKEFGMANRRLKLTSNVRSSGSEPSDKLCSLKTIISFRLTQTYSTMDLPYGFTQCAWMVCWYFMHWWLLSALCTPNCGCWFPVIKIKFKLKGLNNSKEI